MSVCLPGTGIGRAVALRLAQGGWQGDAAVVLVLTGRRAAPLEEAAEAARAAGAAEVLAWPADLTREAEVRFSLLDPATPCTPDCNLMCPPCNRTCPRCNPNVPTLQPHGLMLQPHGLTLQP